MSKNQEQMKELINDVRTGKTDKECLMQGDTERCKLSYISGFWRGLQETFSKSDY
ncbi:MAG: hypothetical protein ACLR7D_08755 [Lachnospira eligens]